MKKSEYIGKPAIAVYAMSAFNGLEIVAIDNDHVIVRDWVHSYTKEGKVERPEIHRYTIYYDTEHPYFIYRNGCRCHLDDFMLVP